MRTLEEMITDVNGGVPSSVKTAAARVGDPLVDRLRKAAGVDDLAHDELREGAARELAEKTAEIAVIALTLAEVDQAAAGGEKTASVAEPTPEQRKTAVFIKMALEQGHSPEEIAGFLYEKEAGIGNLFARGGIAARRAVGKPLSMMTGSMGETIGRREASILRNVHAKGDPGKMGQAIERLRKIYSPDSALRYVKDAGLDTALKEHPSFKDLVSAATRAAGPKAGAEKLPFMGATIGGKAYGVSKETAKKLQLPAAGVAGLAVGKTMLGGDSEKRRGGGPIIIAR